jgi:hypothetical protein
MFGGVHRSSVQADMGRMGVAWFHHTATSQDVTPSRATSLRHPKRLRDRIEDMVDVIDIEDEQQELGRPERRQEALGTIREGSLATAPTASIVAYC